MSFASMLMAHESGRLHPARSYEVYYEAGNRLQALGISLPPEARVLEVQAPWAKMSVDVLAEVLVPSGFVHAGAGTSEALEVIDRVWQENDMDSQFALAAQEALVRGCAYWVLEPPLVEGGLPVVRAMGADRVSARIDYRGEVVEAVAVYRLREDDPQLNGATYYTPGGVVFYELVSGHWVDTGRGREDRFGGAAIVPMFNRARLGDVYGRSELAELAPVIDAASRTLTNLAAGQEVAMWPLRILFGKGAEKAVSSGRRIRNYIGAFLGGPEHGSAAQLTGADVNPVLALLRTYALQVSAMTGIPPSMMGVSTDSNPTSAEALRVAKDRLITRAEGKQRQFGDSLERLGRLFCRMCGVVLPEPERLEVQWRDAATPSASSLMAAMLQAYQEGVVGGATVREYMRLTPQQKAREDARSGDEDAMAGVVVG